MRMVPRLVLGIMRGKKARALKNEAQQKGRLVEQIVAQMHGRPGVEVKTNVKLATVRNPKRYREIDVLMSVAPIPGYVARWAFECRNYAKSIGVQHVGEFADRLKDVGIPLQHGVMVTAKRFTKDALDRAQEMGMKTLLVTGLSPDRLSAAVLDVIQSVVYLLPVIMEFSFVNDLTESKADDMLLFDENDKPQCYILDLAWHQWREGSPPSVIGEYEMPLTLPRGWKQIIEGKTIVPSAMMVKVHIQGLVLTLLSGSGSRHALVDATSGRTERVHVNAKFDQAAVQALLKVFETEQELTDFMNARQEPVKVIARLRLPRLRLRSVFWPPSARAIAGLRSLSAKQSGEMFRDEDLVEIEGTDLSSAWEPPAYLPAPPPKPHP